MGRNNHTITKSQLDHTDTQFSCAAQILVVDRPNGAADILIDTISRLQDQGITVTSTQGQRDTIEALERCYFDLVVIGIEKNRPDNIALVPYIAEHRPGLPVVVVGQHIHHRSRDRALEFGASEVITLPQRADALKTLVKNFSLYYLSPIN